MQTTNIELLKCIHRAASWDLVPVQQKLESPSLYPQLLSCNKLYHKKAAPLSKQTIKPQLAAPGRGTIHTLK